MVEVERGLFLFRYTASAARLAPTVIVACEHGYRASGRTSHATGISDTGPSVRSPPAMPLLFKRSSPLS